MPQKTNSVPKSMLIDATHPEETRVAIIENREDGRHKLSELDLEYSNVRQLKSNIYLAKVTRVEPSLQAAFVEFGNEKQGFLPFSEIHPDYFKIPVADKEALLAEEKAAEAEEDDTEEENEDEEVSTQLDEDEEIEEQKRQKKAMSQLKRKYKIQEVIKKHQIMLVQIVKEERGNKGAALTSYLSIAGRYCVLMPNSHQVGGISKKNSDPKERKRIKKIVTDLEVPDGISLIIRTAGTGRTKAEIKRDYEYLSKLWDTIRKDTMQATAPSLIYEEGDLVKKALRDLYTRDIEDIQISGEDAYKKAKALMKLMIPSHVRRIHQYKDPIIPLFTRYGVETQLDNIYDPVVQLPSGGYLVMNQTEALVSVDVNSGKANKERNIEETAFKTNKEAAVELARQLRLRDLAGLVVVDFIDMDDRRNNRVVEQLLKESLKKDRARMQVGRISSFGLLEMSRQRLRSSVAEMSTQPCPHCQGSGQVLSVPAQALRALRSIEEEGVRNRTAVLTVKATADLGLYILNEKREALADIEARHHLKVVFTIGQDLPSIGFTLENTENLTREQQREYRTDAHKELAEMQENQRKPASRTNNKNTEKFEDDKPKRRRRRGSRRRRNDNDSNENTNKSENDTTTPDQTDNSPQPPEKPDNDSDKPKQRRRRKPQNNNNVKPDIKPDTKAGTKNDATINEGASEAKPAAQKSKKGEQQNPKPATENNKKPEKPKPDAPAKAPSSQVSEQASQQVKEQITDNDKKPKRRGWWGKDKG